MSDMIGVRHREFLELLIKNKAGLTVDNFSKALGITRTAVRQHLATLEANTLVTKSITRPSGGRPEQLYVLTDKGNSSFPRQYSWFAQLLMGMLEQEAGEEGAGARLAAMGETVAKQLRVNGAAGESLSAKVQNLAVIMEELGYRVNPNAPANIKGIPVIEADNCVFHDLASKHPQVCRFDLALLSTFTDSKVVHEACMVKGAHVCRFRFDADASEPISASVAK
ncbi:Predicted transcriptional regulator, ArsR family [Collimonas sp. OK607]|uniref:helix-turn-helix transcriptional regulator n=1 Tax=Collimonas sp. OK607 TaxID=1798194 RepID=UPI0008F080FC|nr:HTH domain-containing protein [Collimonas sp. OK607]SFB33410.1 Predicted transcriptional regulator, ArsR family [Collimonas sp. OK607]